MGLRAGFDEEAILLDSREAEKVIRCWIAVKQKKNQLFLIGVVPSGTVFYGIEGNKTHDESVAVFSGDVNVKQSDELSDELVVQLLDEVAERLWGHLKQEEVHSTYNDSAWVRFSG